MGIVISHLKASLRHGRAGRFLKILYFSVADPLRGRPFGSGGVYRDGEEFPDSHIIFWYM
jgi:hypothetical protein